MLMRRFKTLLIVFMVTASGTFASYKIIKLVAADPMLDQSKFGDVFWGYKPIFRRGMTEETKATLKWKAGIINQSIDEIMPYVLIALFIFLSFGVIAGFKVYSGSWWRN